MGRSNCYTAALRLRHHHQQLVEWPLPGLLITNSYIWSGSTPAGQQKWVGSSRFAGQPLSTRCCRSGA